MGKLIGDAWRHPDKRKKLLVNPEKEMTKAGIKIPNVDKIRIVAVEDTKTTIHLVLPVRPDSVTFTDLKSSSFQLDLGQKLFAACR